MSARCDTVVTMAFELRLRVESYRCSMPPTVSSCLDRSAESDRLIELQQNVGVPEEPGIGRVVLCSTLAVIGFLIYDMVQIVAEVIQKGVQLK